MSKYIQAVRGMNDILPNNTAAWLELESKLIDLMARYGYSQIRLPIVEKTELFKRAVGEATDIVEKEMYTFEDRNGDSLSLRPEGSAGCVRAAIENGLLHIDLEREIPEAMKPRTIKIGKSASRLLDAEKESEDKKAIDTEDKAA